jgi:hypothetical protein
MRASVYVLFLMLLLSFEFDGSASERDDSLRITAGISFKFQGDFAQAERRRVKNMLYAMGYNAQKTLGEFPFPLNFYCRKQEMSQPLGGCLARFDGPRRGVHLGMDLNYSDQQFRESWKIYHEISHLHLPFLEKPSKWFYEGFATYMSRQIMKDMGLFTEESLDEVNRGRFDEIRPDFDREGTFFEVVKYHQENWNFSAFYWGGCTFFYRANRALVAKYDTNLNEIVKEYQKSEREDDSSVMDILRSWDRILGKALFTSLMRKYRTQSARKVMNDV